MGSACNVKYVFRFWYGVTLYIPSKENDSLVYGNMLQGLEPHALFSCKIILITLYLQEIPQMKVIS